MIHWYTYGELYLNEKKKGSLHIAYLTISIYRNMVNRHSQNLCQLNPSAKKREESILKIWHDKDMWGGTCIDSIVATS